MVRGYGRSLAVADVFHRLTKLRLLLDRAVELGMASNNPARGLKLRQPKRVVPPRNLSLEEVEMLPPPPYLMDSLKHMALQAFWWKLPKASIPKPNRSTSGPWPSVRRP